MADQYVKVTRTGWFGNIWNSFIGVLIGGILFVAAFPVLWMNEGRTNMASIAQSSIPVGAASVDPAAEGKQVAVSGTLSSPERLGDASYLQPGPYIQLNRNAEMYAWVEQESTESEKNVGGSTTNKTTYKKEWTSNPKPSSSFEHPEGHSNPDMPIKSASFTVQSASVGAYAIDPSAITMPSASEIALSSDNAGDDDYMRLSENFLFRGRGSPGSPQLGDIRVSYTGVRGGQDVTAFGRQQASKLVPYVTPNQDRLYRIFQGDRESAIKQMDTEYRVIGWILRLVGFLMMWIGLCMCFGPINAILDVLPFLGSAGRFVVGLVALPIALIFSIITIVISMLAHNPLALIVLLALIIGGVVAWSRMRRPSAGPAAA